jgi:rhodanese-related sulfurtransferase
VLVVDTRPSAQFMDAFVHGSVCVPRSKSFLNYFGAVAPAEAPVALLVADEAHVKELAGLLHLIGFDDLRGWALAADVLAADGPGGSDHLTLDAVTLDEARARLSRDAAPQLIDVRSASERAGGMIPGATSVALTMLDDWARDHAEPATPVIVHCQTGTRAIIGASVLRARGFTDVTPLTGGFEAWTAVGLPVHTPAAP